MTSFKKAILRGVSLLLMILPATGCESPSTKKQLNELVKELEGTVGDATEALQNFAPKRNKLQSTATEELEKLFVFEYRVVEFPLELTSDSLQEELTKLGKERWECFHAEAGSRTIRFYCKRRPKSYLRYVPKFL